jgi:hypothetical protein
MTFSRRAAVVTTKLVPARMPPAGHFPRRAVLGPVQIRIDCNAQTNANAIANATANIHRQFFANGFSQRFSFVIPDDNTDSDADNGRHRGALRRRQGASAAAMTRCCRLSRNVNSTIGCVPPMQSSG